MAGTYGLHRANFRNSLRAGWPLIKAMRDPALPVGTTECSACKIQMEQGTTKPTIHPLKLAGAFLRPATRCGATVEARKWSADGHVKIELRLFAGIRDEIGTDVLQLELTEPATISALRQQLDADYPADQPAASAFQLCHRSTRTPTKTT